MIARKQWKSLSVDLWDSQLPEKVRLVKIVADR